jgi:hypothetical protein
MAGLFSYGIFYANCDFLPNVVFCNGFPKFSAFDESDRRGFRARLERVDPEHAESVAVGAVFASVSVVAHAAISKRFGKLPEKRVGHRNETVLRGFQNHAFAPRDVRFHGKEESESLIAREFAHALDDAVPDPESTVFRFDEHSADFGPFVGQGQEQARAYDIVDAFADRYDQPVRFYRLRIELGWTPEHGGFAFRYVGEAFGQIGTLFSGDVFRSKEPYVEIATHASKG